MRIYNRALSEAEVIRNYKDEIMEQPYIPWFEGVKLDWRVLAPTSTLVVTADLSQAGASDALEHTVDYGEIYSRVKGVVEGPSLNLIEAVGERICDEVLQVSNRIESVEAVVSKPAAPLQGALQHSMLSLP